LKVLTLEENLSANFPIDEIALDDGGAMNMRLDAGMRILNIA
jgi:hypothetical protein